MGFNVYFSGQYIETKSAVDNFSGQNGPIVTGFASFFSGSGYWLVSGSSYLITKFLYDGFTGYLTGYKNNDFLNQGIESENFNYLYGARTGTTLSNDDYLFDGFTGYATGTFLYGNFLKSGYAKRIYDYVYGFNTGVIINSMLKVPNSGYVDKTWFFSDASSITNMGPFAEAKSFYSNYGSTAWIPFDPEYLLGDYTVEVWTYSLPQILQGAIVSENGGTAGGSGFLIGRYVDGIWYPPQFRNLSSFVSGSGSQFSTGAWFHMAGVRTTGGVGIGPSGLYLYVSGKLVGGVQSGVVVDAMTGRLRSTSPIGLGRERAWQIDNIFPEFFGMYSGYIAEFRLWNYARSEEQINAWTGQKVSPFSSGLVLYLSL